MVPLTIARLEVEHEITERIELSLPAEIGRTLVRFITVIFMFGSIDVEEKLAFVSKRFVAVPAFIYTIVARRDIT
jgi:hypothetical protein